MEKKVLVTGATRGIGQAIASKFKKEGSYVIGTGSYPQAKPDYLDELIVCDFTDNAQLENMCENIKHHKINVLINNAGINKSDSFCNIKPSDFERIQQVNVYAPFRISQAVIPGMELEGWGRIVNVSSVWGKISKTGRASYSASKFAIDGMTVAMASELSPRRILCNCVAPGFIDTEMTWTNLGAEGVGEMLKSVPIQRLAKVEEVANLVYMLGSEHNTYISGQNIAIDGGFTRA